MMRFNLSIISSLLLLMGCGEASRKDLLPRNTGAKGEFVIVAPSQVWTTAYKDAISQAFSEVLYGLPQEELVLNRVELKEIGFKDMFKTHRNILKIEVHPDKKNAVQVKRDVYARQQLFIRIIVPDLEELPGVLDGRADDILQLFHEAEIDRLIDRNRAFGSKELNQQVKEITGLEIIMQDKFQIAVNQDGFLWMRLDQSKPVGGYQHSISQGIMIYRRPYSDTIQFSDSSIYEWKNRMNKVFVEGPQKSYMNISDRFLLPRSEYITFLDNSAKEIRGLWRMEGYFMGGPFYALSFYNPANQKQYMVEGYAYAPQFDKAPLVREIEAICKSVSTPEETTQATQSD